MYLRGNNIGKERWMEREENIWKKGKRREWKMGGLKERGRERVEGKEERRIRKERNE